MEIRRSGSEPESVRSGRGAGRDDREPATLAGPSRTVLLMVRDGARGYGRIGAAHGLWHKRAKADCR
jgi:hypothetical protein